MTKSILFVLKDNNEQLGEAAFDLASRCTHKGCNVFVTDNESSTVSGLPAMDANERPDLIVTLGGDGTILRAVRSFRSKAAPFLGIKLGKLGFLTGATLEEAREAIDAALEGRACIEKRNLVEVSIYKDEKLVVLEHALNEIVAGRPAGAPLITTRLKINGHQLYTTSGDGLIISSSTGSTAYALSAGGPIMSPEFDGLVVVPLASHTLIQRAVVTGSQEIITLDFPDEQRALVEFSFDGLSTVQVHKPSRAVFRVAQETISLIKLDSRLFYDTVASEFFRGQQEG